MAFFSHPLDIDDGTRYSTRSIPDRHSSAVGYDNNPWAFDSPLDTVHPLDECHECHSYIRHVDVDLLSHSPPSTSALRSPRTQGTFLEGIEVGRRLQRDADDTMLSRFRGRLESANERYEESAHMITEYQSRVEALEHELALARDELVALQMAFDELSTEHGRAAGGDSDWNPPPPPPPPKDANFSARHIELTASPREADPEEEELWEEDFPDCEPRDTWSDSSDYEDFLVQQQIALLDESDGAQLWDDYHRVEYASDNQDSSPSSLTPSSWGAITDPYSSLSSLDSPASPLPLPPLPSAEQELTIAQLSELVEAAHQPGNTTALEEVRLLIQDAERTPRNQRTTAQIYLLLTWRSPDPGSSSRGVLSTSLIPKPYAPSASTSSPGIPEMFVDASPYGVGLIFGTHWLAWTFLRSHPALPRGQDGHPIMSWAELVAVELGVRTFIAAGYRDVAVTIRSDNIGVVKALKTRTWTPKYNLDSILHGIMGLCDAAGLQLRAKWVWTKVNPADAPSRKIYPPMDRMFPLPAEIPAYLRGMVKLVE